VRRLLVLLFVASLAAATAATGASREAGTVARVIDGDTLVLTSGQHVRFLQIDSTELGSGDCYSRAAANDLRRLLPVGTPIRLDADPRLDRIDRYGRLLRYVFRGGTNVNVELVARGDATVWFYGGVRGRYASALLRATDAARAARRGLWGACDVTWNPDIRAIVRPRTAHPGAGVAKTNCDPSYPTVCIPPPPPDLDCADIAYRNFKVLPPDPHRFDGDHDGIGCEET
jgi:micrococcal nuclease